jgi:hypothetical protein
LLVGKNEGKTEKKLLKRMSSSSVSMKVSNQVMKGLESLMNETKMELVRSLSEKYGFNAEEAMESLCVSLSVNAGKREKSDGGKRNIPMPFDGTVWDDCCNAIKPTHGLYSQCANKRGDNEFCQSCTKMEKNGKLIGRISERQEQGDNWRDPKGRKPVHYLKVLKYLKLSRADVDAYLLEEDFHISEKHFIEEDKSRGRPKKSAAVSDSESESASKKRGRPKKSEKVVEVSTTEDLFSTLISDAKSPRSPAIAEVAKAEADEMSDISDNESEKSEDKKKGKSVVDKAMKLAEKEAEKAKKLAEKEAEKAKKLAEKEAEKAKKLAELEAAKQAKLEEKAKKLAEKEAKKQPKKAVAVEAPVEAEEEEDEDEEKVTLNKFSHEGVSYFKDNKGNVYNKKQEKVGVWNESRNKIDLVADDELETEASESDSESDSDSDEE